MLRKRYNFEERGSLYKFKIQFLEMELIRKVSKDDMEILGMDTNIDQINYCRYLLVLSNSYGVINSRAMWNKDWRSNKVCSVA